LSEDDDVISITERCKPFGRESSVASGRPGLPQIYEGLGMIGDPTSTHALRERILFPVIREEIPVPQLRARARDGCVKLVEFGFPARDFRRRNVRYHGVV
jgi:hypothetical protein